MTPSPTARLKRYFRRHRRQYLLGLFLIVTTNVFNTAFPWFIQHIIDGMEGPGVKEWIAIFCLILVGIAVGAGFFRVFSRIVVFKAGRDIEYELRNELFDHLQKLAPSFYQRYRTGDLMSRLTNDLGSVRLLLGPGILNLSNTPLIYAMTLGAMVLISPLLTLAVLIPFPFFVYLVRAWSRRYYERTLASQRSLARLNARIQENLNGVSIVKLYAREHAEIEDFDRYNRDYYQTNCRMIRMSSLMMPVVNSVPGFGILVVLFLGGHQVIGGALTIGQFVTLLLYVFNLSWPTFILGWVLTLYQRGLSAMGRLSELLDAEVTIPDSPEEGSPTPIEGRIEIDHLSFDYSVSPEEPKRPPTLKDISLKIEPGSFVGIVGETGSGKSTLLELIPHLYEISEGEISIDGQRIDSVSLHRLRSAIGYAPQEAFLFSTTIAENIAFGLPKVSIEKVKWAAEIAGVRKEIESFPMGMQTVVGERGVTLSGGQRQRIALARALAIEPKILILDDSLSSVDAETERKILSRLRQVFPGKTVLMVSHRAAALEEADLLVVLKGGRIVEQGRPKELLEKGGFYADFVRRQKLEEELEGI